MFKKKKTGSKDLQRNFLNDFTKSPEKYKNKKDFKKIIEEQYSV